MSVVVTGLGQGSHVNILGGLQRSLASVDTPQCRLGGSTDRYKHGIYEFVQEIEYIVQSYNLRLITWIHRL